MALNEEDRTFWRQALGKLEEQGPLVAFSVDDSPDASDRTQIHLVIIGKPTPDLDRALGQLRSLRDVILQVEQQAEEFYFFGDLRPGAGLLRRGGGRSGGPGGTLTCFLESTANRKSYFASAGHILSNYWSVKPINESSDQVDDRDGAIYVNRKGFPALSTPRFLGKLSYLSDSPSVLETAKSLSPSDQVDVDIGIVEIKGEFELKRPTCYKFGTLSSEPESVVTGQVMKCGAEEVHWTAAVVEGVRPRLYVYGPGPKPYVFRNQVVLRSLSERDEEKIQEPRNPSKTPFAVSGDSGTMVVDLDTKRPVGMLIAGSILDGKYVMTPIRALWQYWTNLGFIFHRPE